MLLKWKIPDTSEVTYDISLIERATSQGGSYSQISSQAIADNTYFDQDGTTSHWYKVRFRGGSVGSYFYSAYSDEMQGGAWRGYCTPDDVRVVANLSSEDVTDSRLYDLITFAMIQINHEINSRIIEERVSEIDSTRENTIDGVNATFYVQRSFQWYIGDMDDDGDVGISDIKVYKYAVDGTKTEMTVSEIYPNEGRFVLESAPESGSSLTVTYCYAPVSESDPHPLLKQVCSYLAASLSFTRIETGYYERLQLGKLSLTNMTSGYTQFYGMYEKALHQLKSRMVRRTDDPSLIPKNISKKEGLYIIR